eukprot:9197624-Alexandrium_andersonii.AAC.1
MAPALARATTSERQGPERLRVVAQPSATAFAARLGTYWVHGAGRAKEAVWQPRGYTLPP